ncbi:hypothetical protein JKP88DRAFT_299379 [Tribonema minus]|uniref:Uncharacterized protein n=1 Tax=Tribonema minus TaxID=303371 RepID=A0A835ZDR0_9STRA|nr:hypothetical protein JKP88DRAFT_299379 [Tribonema minus]
MKSDSQLQRLHGRTQSAHEQPKSEQQLKQAHKADLIRAPITSHHDVNADPGKEGRVKGTKRPAASAAAARPSMLGCAVLASTGAAYVFNPTGIEKPGAIRSKYLKPISEPIISMRLRRPVALVRVTFARRQLLPSDSSSARASLSAASRDRALENRGRRQWREIQRSARTSSAAACVAALAVMVYVVASYTSAASREPICLQEPHIPPQK